MKARFGRKLPGCAFFHFEEIIMTSRTLLLLSVTSLVACSPRPESRETPPPPTTTMPSSTDTSTMRPDSMRTDTTLRDTSRMAPTTPAR